MRSRRSFKEFIEMFNLSSSNYRNIFKGFEILKEMFMNDVFIFLSFTEHAVLEHVLYRTIIDLVDRELVDALMTYSPVLDIEIRKILKSESTDKFREIVLNFINGFNIDKINCPSEFLKLFFKYLHDSNIVDCETLFVKASLRNVDIFIPDITHSIFIKNIINIDPKLRYVLDVLKDEKVICDIMFENKKVGAIFLVGSLPKHHVQWWSAIRDGLDYVIQITPISEYDGSLSGARIEESITWNQLKPDGKGVSIMGDPVILFPLLINAVFEEFES